MTKHDADTIVFFDFDSTISSKDSLVDFIQFAVGSTCYYTGLLYLLPTLIAYTLKLLPNQIAKERMISLFFKGWPAGKFQALADHYSRTRLDTIVREQARKRINWHQSQGHKVVVVSASMESWLQLWCKSNQLELIATQLEITNGQLTGRFTSRNCYGAEKVNRIQSRYDLSTFRHIYAYGDSRGDKPMLSLADKAFYRCYE